MRIKKVTRYYCEFCGKGALKRKTMENHERGCTNNPNRVCGICARYGLKQLPMDELVVLAMTDGDYGEMPDNQVAILRSAVDYCPACMLAAARNAKSGIPEFNPSKEFKDFFREERLNEENARADLNAEVSRGLLMSSYR